MNYLTAEEYELFGIDTATAESWVGAASRLMEAHCRRSTLLAQQYTERFRLPNGKASFLLTYLPPMAITPATSAVVSARGRYAPTKNNYAITELGSVGEQIAQAFSIPGTWVAIDPSALDLDPNC